LVRKQERAQEEADVEHRHSGRHERKETVERRARPVVQAEVPRVVRENGPEQRGHQIGGPGRDGAVSTHAGPSPGRRGPIGSSILIVRPPASGRSASICPSCASIVRLTIASPSPVPCGLSEKNGSKRRGTTSTLTPGPSSLTSIASVPFRLVSDTARRPSGWP